MAGSSNIRFVTGGYTEQMRIWNNGNISINNTSDAGYRLDVVGTGRFSGQLTVTSSTVASVFTAGNGGYSIIMDR